MKPILVFDGAKLEMKDRVERDRQKLREEARLKSISMHANGDFTGA